MRPETRERELRHRGLPSEQAWKSSVNGRGPWWNANAPHMLKAFTYSVFRRMGLYSLLSKACPLNPHSDFRKCRMPNGTSERSALIEHCGVGGSVRKGTLYPISLLSCFIERRLDNCNRRATFIKSTSPCRRQIHCRAELLTNQPAIDYTA